MSYNIFTKALGKWAERNNHTLNEQKLQEDISEVEKTSNTQEVVVMKANDVEQRITVEIVAEPFTPDAHNEWYSDVTIAEGFESADKAWKEDRLPMNLFHQYDDVTKANVELIKHYLVPFDCSVNDVIVKEGTWVAEVHWPNESLWKMRTELLEDGTTAIAGLSLKGMGHRVTEEEKLNG